MKLSTSLLAPAIFGAACAASENANVFLFSNLESPKQSHSPTLSPDAAALVIAQRVGVSQYHNLEDASEGILSHINTFGGPRPQLFGNEFTNAVRPQLVLMVDGVKQPFTTLDYVSPAFYISSPPSKLSNKRFIADLRTQIGSSSAARDCSFEEKVNPLITECWNGPTNAIYLDVSQGSQMSNLEYVQKEVLQLVGQDILDVMIIVMPPVSSSSGSSKSPYGTYEVPSSKLIQRQAEEPMTVHSDASFQQTSQPSVKVAEQVSYDNASYRPALLPVCFASLKSCESATSSCSGRGECKLKYGKEGETDRDKSACFACQCSHTIVHNNDTTFKTVYWGGPACSKEDISGPFWLLAIFSVVLVGLVTWAIGMMFAVGEEKLPGVIGAGVSGPKAR